MFFSPKKIENGMFEFMLANYPTESMNKLILTDNKIDFTNKPLGL